MNKSMSKIKNALSILIVLSLAIGYNSLATASNIKQEKSSAAASSTSSKATSSQANEINLGTGVEETFTTATPKSELPADAFMVDGTENRAVVYQGTPSMAPQALPKLGDGVTASTWKPEYLYGGYVITDPLYMWGNFQEFRNQMDYEFLTEDYPDGTKSGLLFYSLNAPETDQTSLDMTTMQRALEIPELNKALYNDKVQDMLNGLSEMTLKDIDGKQPYDNAVAIAVYYGVLTGDSNSDTDNGYFNGDKPLSRLTAYNWLARAVDTTYDAGIADTDEFWNNASEDNINVMDLSAVIDGDLPISLPKDHFPQSYGDEGIPYCEAAYMIAEQCFPTELSSNYVDLEEGEANMTYSGGYIDKALSNCTGYFTDMKKAVVVDPTKTGINSGGKPYTYTDLIQLYEQEKVMEQQNNGTIPVRYAAALMLLKDKGIIQANADGSIGWAKTITRGQFIKMMYDAMMKNGSTLVRGADGVVECYF